MAFCRCFYCNSPHIRYAPNQCHNVIPKPKPEIKEYTHNALFKCASFGSLTLNESARKNDNYDLAAVHMKTCQTYNTCLELSFACNIIQDVDDISLYIQIFKLTGSISVLFPVSAPYFFMNKGNKGDGNTICFTIQDFDCAQQEEYVYFAKLYLANKDELGGYVQIRNPLLTVFIP